MSNAAGKCPSCSNRRACPTRLCACKAQVEQRMPTLALGQNTKIALPLRHPPSGKNVLARAGKVLMTSSEGSAWSSLPNNRLTLKHEKPAPGTARATTGPAPRSVLPQPHLHDGHEETWKPPIRKLSREHIEHVPLPSCLGRLVRRLRPTRSLGNLRHEERYARWSFPSFCMKILNLSWSATFSFARRIELVSFLLLLATGSKLRRQPLGRRITVGMQYPSPLHTP